MQGLGTQKEAFMIPDQSLLVAIDFSESSMLAVTHVAGVGGMNVRLR